MIKILSCYVYTALAAPVIYKIQLMAY